MVNGFPKGISPKVNATAQLELDLTYYDVTVLYVSHNARFLLPWSAVKSIKKKLLHSLI